MRSPFTITLDNTKNRKSQHPTLGARNTRSHHVKFFLKIYTHGTTTCVTQFFFFFRMMCNTQLVPKLRKFWTTNQNYLLVKCIPSVIKYIRVYKCHRKRIQVKSNLRVIWKIKWVNVIINFTME